MHYGLCEKWCTEDTKIFTTLTGDGTAILRGHPSYAKVYLLERQRDYLPFLVILSPWSGPGNPTHELPLYRLALNRLS